MELAENLLRRVTTFLFPEEGIVLTVIICNTLASRYQLNGVKLVKEVVGGELSGQNENSKIYHKPQPTITRTTKQSQSSLCGSGDSSSRSCPYRLDNHHSLLLINTWVQLQVSSQSLDITKALLLSSLIIKLLRNNRITSQIIYKAGKLSNIHAVASIIHNHHLINRQLTTIQHASTTFPQNRNPQYRTTCHLIHPIRNGYLHGQRTTEDYDSRGAHIGN